MLSAKQQREYDRLRDNLVLVIELKPSWTTEKIARTYALADHRAPSHVRLRQMISQLRGGTSVSSSPTLEEINEFKSLIK